MLLLLALLSPALGQGSSHEQGAGEPLPAHVSPAAGEFEALLDGAMMEGAYRVGESFRFFDLPLESAQASEVIRAAGRSISGGGVLPTCREWLATWRAAGTRATSPLEPEGLRVRDLFVISSAERVIEAFHNTDDELDFTAVWTPVMVLEYNPGRRQVSFRVQEEECQLLGMETLYFPARLAATLEPRSHTRAGEIERFEFGREEMTLVCLVERGLPIRTVFVDRDRACIASEFEYGPAGDSGVLALTRSRRTDAYQTGTGLQVQAFERELSAVDLARGPEPIEVDSKHNLFLTSSDGTNAEFRGRLGAHPVPELLRPLIRVTDSPRPPWRR